MNELVFTDAKGRDWDLTLNLGIAKRIDASNFQAHFSGKWSFLKPDKGVMSNLLASNSFMFALVFTIVLDQAKKYFAEGKFLFGKWEVGKPTDNSDVFEPFTPAELRAAVADAFSQRREIDAEFTNFELAELEFAFSIDSQAIENGRAAFWRSLGDFFRDQKTVLDVLMRQYQSVLQQTAQKIKEMEPEMQSKLEQALQVDLNRIRSKLDKLSTSGMTPGESLGKIST